MTRPFDMSQLMQQAQEVSEKLQRAQEALRHRVVEATVGGGMVTVRVNGKVDGLAGLDSLIGFVPQDDTVRSHQTPALALTTALCHAGSLCLLA